MIFFQTNRFCIIYIGFIVFIIISLIQDHSKHGFLFTNRSVNASYFIENALKRIEICQFDDRIRQRKLLYALQEWTHLADMYHIRYWMGHQTLLSYVQYNNLSPYVSHIDMFIMNEDTPKLIRLNIEKDIYSFDYSHNNQSIRIWPIYIDYSNQQETLLVQYKTSNEKISTPIHWTFPLELCIFSGIKLWRPVKAKKLVDHVYGAILPDISCVNGAWTRMN